MRSRRHRLIAIGFFALALALTVGFASALTNAHAPGRDAGAHAPRSIDAGAGAGDGLALGARVTLALEVLGVPVHADPALDQGVATPAGAPVTPTDVSAGTPDAPDAGLPVDARLDVDARLAPVDARAGEPTQVWSQGAGAPAPGSALVAPAFVAGAAAAAAAAGAAAWKWPALKRWLVRFAWVPLYAKVARHRVLENDVRDGIFALVRAEPGITTSEIAKRANVSWGTTVYHLEVLEQNRMVVSEKHGRYRRYFENGAPAGPERKAVSVLRNDTSAAIADVVRSEPGLTGRELAKASGLSPQALHWHAQRLARAGVVRKERDGRVVRYYRA